MASHSMDEPLLPETQTRQYERERDSVLQELRDGKQGLLGAASAQVGLSYARTKTLQRNSNHNNKTSSRGKEWRIPTWLRWPSAVQLPVALPVKAGLAAVIASLMSQAPGFLSIFSKNTAWAVVTVDIVMETSVGLTLSKGTNRTVGTLLAALLAILVNVLVSTMGRFDKPFLALCVFLGGAIPTFFKFRRPFSDRWNYAVVMAMVTFHLLILTPSDQKLRLPLLRLGLIVLGFVIAIIVNVALLPNFAGSNANALLAKNFVRAGNVIERCTVEYCRGTVLQQHPEAHNHASSDELHGCFHELVTSDSEVDKLLDAARFEPPHGKFFLGYPWNLYRELGENLRFAYYDIVALDNSLRAEIQAPLHLRTMFEVELLALGKEIAQVFRELGTSMLKMEKHALHKVLDRADEIALLLQHKIAKQSALLLLLGPREESEEEGTEHHRHGREASKMIEGEEEKQIEGMTSAGSAHYLQRKGSISYHWECTAQRLAAMSLLKFSSLLIEIAAKSKHVVEIADELAEKARFDECTSIEEAKPSDEFVKAFGSV